ncbi:MAG: class I SAM-dependent methyltransferase [Verrucomicrobia bacterium]|nr:class I SAM-dependent methyltransferase [Verrucomicrobiota bacterium]
MSTAHIYAKVLELADGFHRQRAFRQHLDIGAGRGELIAKFKERFQTEAAACDYTDELMKLPGQRVDIADLNTQPLPYPDASFDLVTATEVIEHLEDFRRVVREVRRVLKPGGVCILSTPNILNLNSRLRFLSFGFWNLFGPLPVKHSRLYSTGGHINPCSWFYIAHALLDAGFAEVTPHIDKVQRSAIPKLVVLWPFIKLFGARALAKERNRFKTLDTANEPLVRAMNSTPLLLGRTIIACAVKPAK